MSNVARRFVVTVAGLCCLALVFGAGWWAASATFGSRSPKEVVGEAVSAEAREGTVGRVFNFGLTVKIPTAPVASNPLSGVVTKIGDTQASQGGILYVIGEQPVLAAVSPTPFYRDLADGSRGDDVKALQQMLKDRGFFQGDPDGVFGPQTTRAMKALQKEFGSPQSGTAPLGSLVAFPQLPAQVSFKEGFRPGVVVSGGEDIVSSAIGEREFYVSVSDSQLEFVPVGASVSFTYGGEKFSGIVAKTDQQSGLDQFKAELTGVDGGSVCDTRCDVLPAAAETSLLAQVRPEEPISGIVVPAAAVQSTSNGSTFVTLADGTRRDVTVRGSGQGLVVVDGVSAGEKVRLSAKTAKKSGSSPSPSVAESPAE